MATSAVGLDIGTRMVHVALAEVKGGTPTITNYGGAALPEGAVREGEIVSVADVAAAIAGLMKTAKIRKKDVHLGVANQQVAVRQVDLPWMAEEELRESLQYQVQEYIPLPIEDAELDFYILEEFVGPDDQRMLRTLLVAAQREMVLAHVAAARKAGLRPVSVDLNPFSVLRTLAGDSFLGPDSDVIVDYGAGVTNLIVHAGGLPQFVRILTQGSDEITAGIGITLNIDADEAEAIKRRDGLEGAAADPATPVIAERASRWIEEIRNSIDYFTGQAGGTRPKRVVLSGGGSLLRGLPAKLGDAVGLPVVMGDALDMHPTRESSLTPGEVRAVGPALNTAVGLALGGLE